MLYFCSLLNENDDSVSSNGSICWNIGNPTDTGEEAVSGPVDPSGSATDLAPIRGQNLDCVPTTIRYYLRGNFLNCLQKFRE